MRHCLHKSRYLAISAMLSTSTILYVKDDAGNFTLQPRALLRAILNKRGSLRYQTDALNDTFIYFIFFFYGASPASEFTRLF